LINIKNWYRLPEITNDLYDNVPAPRYTWVVMIDEHYQSLGVTYGPIFVLIDMYKCFHGDDFTAGVELMASGCEFSN
jgi:hypothetical protein